MTGWSLARLTATSLIAGAIVSAAFAEDPKASTGAKVNEAAPAFTLTDTTGKEHSLAEFKGKVVVLEWTNYECPFVRKHYDSGNMQKLQKSMTGQGVVWLSICSSAKGKQGNFPAEKWNALIAEKQAVPTAVLLDESGTVGKSYGAKSTPSLFVIDKEGVLRYAGAIDNKPTPDKNDIATADNYVVAAVEAVLKGEKPATQETKSYGCPVKY